MIKRTLPFMTAAIALLALIAAGAGVLWQGTGAPFAYTTARGATVQISNHGLYTYDSVSIVTQAIAQDWVTLLLGIPLLALSGYLFHRGSLRGQILLVGTLGYFLYTYASYAFGAAYNELFLVYVALFSLSLFAFVLALMGVDPRLVAAHIAPALPRRIIGFYLYFVGGFLLLAWLGRILPGLFSGTDPDTLESSTTLFIQVLDLGLIVPLAFLAGNLLWRGTPGGYLLAAIMLVKGMTLTVAVSMMALAMVRAGVPVSAMELAVFPTLTVIGVALTISLLRNIQQGVVSQRRTAHWGSAARG